MENGIIVEVWKDEELGEEVQKTSKTWR